MISIGVKNQIFKISGFTLIFGLIKLNAFTATLFLSNFTANASDYGLFEYALSFGLILAIPLDFGLQVAYPFFNLKLKKEGFRSIFFLHAVLVSGTILTFLSLQWIYQPILSDKWNLILLLGGIVFCQCLSASILKSHEKIFTAVFIEAGILLFLNGYNFYLWMTYGVVDFTLLRQLFTIYITLFFCTNLYWFIMYKNKCRLHNYLVALQYGKPIVLAAFLIIWLTGGARVFIEYFLGLELVGIYSIYIRLTGIMLMLSQIVNIVFFKKIYQTTPKILDTWFMVFIIGVFIIGLSIYGLIPILGNFFQIINQSWGQYHKLFILLSFHMIFWIGIALHENVLYREQLAEKMNKWFIVLILLMVSFFFIFQFFNILNIFTLAIINVIALFLATEIQNYLLATKAIHLPKTRIVNRCLAGGVGIFILLAFC